MLQHEDCSPMRKRTERKTGQDIIAKTLYDDTIFMRRWYILWTIVIVVAVIFTNWQVLVREPTYWQDWRALTTIAVSCCMITIFLYAIYHSTHRNSWPPPFWVATAFWSGMYACYASLLWIDWGFNWNVYPVLGFLFMLFTVPRIILFIAILAVTWGYGTGALAWPLTITDVGSFLGVMVSFLGLAISSVLLQYMLSDRFTRNALVRELAQTNEELTEAQRQLAASVEHEQELAVLRERTRLAREMHDTLGHALVLVSVKLEAAQRLRERDPVRCDQELEQMKQIVRTSMGELRSSIAALRSPALELEPAAHVLARYAREAASRAGWHITCDFDPAVEDLPAQVEETLWKVGQEALINVEKHACARNVILALQRWEGHVRLRVQDDGIGLPSEIDVQQGNTQLDHYGLSGMAERVAGVEGQLRLLSSPGRGTTIEVDLPLAMWTETDSTYEVFPHQ